LKIVVERKLGGGINIRVKFWWTVDDDERLENVLCLMIIDSWK
jgi:hypothetical protein